MGGATPAPIAGTPPPAITPGSTAPAWHESIITKDAAGVESLRPYSEWQGQAPEPLRKFINDNMTAARSKTDGLLKVPGAADPPEAWDSVWKAIGRPDKPEEYGITKPEVLPDGVGWNDDQVKEFTAIAHKSGLSKGQAAALVTWQQEQLGKHAAGMREAGEKFVADERAALNQTFGPRLAEVAERAQAAATAAGENPQILNPAAGEFVGKPALNIIATLQKELATLKGEANFNAGGGPQPTQSGRAYVDAVLAGKHADSVRFYGDPKAGAKADPEFQKYITDMNIKGS